MQASNGDIFGKFDQVGDYSFELVAVDLGGQEQVVETIQFKLSEVPQFNLVLNGNGRHEIGQFGGSEHTDPASKQAQTCKHCLYLPLCCCCTCYIRSWDSPTCRLRLLCLS